MKIEDLTKLGIAEDVAKQVVSMNETEVSAEAKKLTDKEAELTMATDKIKELTETVKKFDGVDVEKMKSDLADWSKRYAEDTAALKLDNALSKMLSTCGAKDADIVGKLIDRSIIKLDGDKLIGVSEQLSIRIFGLAVPILDMFKPLMSRQNGSICIKHIVVITINRIMLMGIQFLQMRNSI